MDINEDYQLTKAQSHYACRSLVDRVKELELERDQLAARNARLMAAAKPFADAAESVRSALEPRKDHEDYYNMQAFLDGNRVTPAVEFCGNWRILANVYRESPAASLAEIEARAVERAINAAEGIWSGDIGDEVVLMKDLQDHVNQLRNQHKEEN